MARRIEPALPDPGADARGRTQALTERSTARVRSKVQSEQGQFSWALIFHRSKINPGLCFCEVLNTELLHRWTVSRLKRHLPLSGEFRNALHQPQTAVPPQQRIIVARGPDLLC